MMLRNQLRKERDMTEQEQKQELEDFQRRFEAELKKQPEISDEDFMAEYEASDAEYGIGVTLPAPAKNK